MDVDRMRQKWLPELKIMVIILKVLKMFILTKLRGLVWNQTWKITIHRYKPISADTETGDIQLKTIKKYYSIDHFSNWITTVTSVNEFLRSGLHVSYHNPFFTW